MIDYSSQPHLEDVIKHFRSQIGDNPFASLERFYQEFFPYVPEDYKPHVNRFYEIAYTTSLLLFMQGFLSSFLEKEDYKTNYLDNPRFAPIRSELAYFDSLMTDTQEPPQGDNDQSKDI